MSTLHTKGYTASRGWSDQYTESLSQIGVEIMYKNNLMGCYFVPPTLNQDRKHGIDMIVVTETIKMSYRVRQASALPYWEKGFTIRTSSRGYPSELDKIQSPGFADYLVYGIAHPTKYGEVQGAVMIDLKSVGAQLVADPSLIKKATKKNDFIEFKYTDFPDPIIVGLYGIDNKGELDKYQDSNDPY